MMVETARDAALAIICVALTACSSVKPLSRPVPAHAMPFETRIYGLAAVYMPASGRIGLFIMRVGPGTATDAPRDCQGWRDWMGQPIACERYSVVPVSEALANLWAANGCEPYRVESVIGSATPAECRALLQSLETERRGVSWRAVPCIPVLALPVARWLVE